METGPAAIASALVFGDYILGARIPTAKILFDHATQPGVLQGKGEYLIIGAAEMIAHCCEQVQYSA